MTSRLTTIQDGNARWYVIQTQNLEEYGTNFHKFKGGSEYCVYFEVTLEPWDEEHMYEVPSLTELQLRFGYETRQQIQRTKRFV